MRGDARVLVALTRSIFERVQVCLLRWLAYFARCLVGLGPTPTPNNVENKLLLLHCLLTMSRALSHYGSVVVTENNIKKHSWIDSKKTEVSEWVNSTQSTQPLRLQFPWCTPTGPICRVSDRRLLLITATHRDWSVGRKRIQWLLLCPAPSNCLVRCFSWSSHIHNETVWQMNYQIIHEALVLL